MPPEDLMSLVAASPQARLIFFLPTRSESQPPLHSGCYKGHGEGGAAPCGLQPSAPGAGQTCPARVRFGARRRFSQQRGHGILQV